MDDERAIDERLEAEYNNRARVPGHGAVMAGWQAEAEAWRRRGPAREIAYGSGSRETLDLFDAGGGGGGATVLFIHGGYWQALDKGWFSHLAGGLNPNGIDVAIPNYDLCPAVGIADILEQMRRAVEVLHRDTGRPVVAAGHSAGGHLSACLLATDWAARGLPRDLVRAAYAVSGLFDLEPLVRTSLNSALGLDVGTARALSPVRWSPPVGLTLDAVVGGAESDGFLGQSRDMVAAWGAKGVTTRFEAIPGLDHFTVLGPLADPASPQAARLVQLAGM